MNFLNFQLLLCLVWASSPAWAAPVLTSADLVDPNRDGDEPTFLTPEDFAAAKNLDRVDLRALGILSTNEDPVTRANKFEGDIAGQTSRSIGKFINDSNALGRNAIRDQWRKWPDGKIPYVLSSRYGSYSKKVIAAAMEQYHKNTCIQFVPRDPDVHRDYVNIFPDDGCYSLVGRVGGKQDISLDAGCIEEGTVIHELMHTVGFYHEQSRTDRDDWIDINWNNVIADAVDQFEKYSLRTITNLGAEYDYASIMHYGAFAFSKNGLRTIVPKKSGGDKIGQRQGFSRTDLTKVNKLYDCAEGEATINPGDDGDDDGDLTLTTMAARTTTTRRPARPAVCIDQKWQCYFWKLLGYCKKYETYMKSQCPKACDACEADSDSPGPRKPSVKVTCVDTSDHCQRWAKNGYCIKDGFSDYMRKNCKLSCSYC